MITIKVLAEDGWQNGEHKYPVGKVYNLECDEETIQPFIDAGVLELVKATKEVEDPDAKMKELVNLAVEAAAKTFAELQPKTPVVKVHDRADDDPTGGFQSIAHVCKAIYQADSHNNENSAAVKSLRAWDNKTSGHMTEGEWIALRNRKVA